LNYPQEQDQDPLHQFFALLADSSTVDWHTIFNAAADAEQAEKLIRIK
jgi:hypothetical protein